MKKRLSEQVVAMIRNSLPVNQNIVSFLADMFFWSKEAIYRRLRSEIPFSYEEIVLIARKLDFSIDNIIRLNQLDRVLYDLCLPQSDDPADLYCEKREQLNTLSYKIGTSKGSDSIFAINYIPYSFIIFFEPLAKFDYYKWLQRTQRVRADVVMSEVEIPQKLTDIHDVWTNQDRTNSTVTYILDSNVFSSIVRDIDYFYKRELINGLELEQLRESLLDLLNKLIAISDSSYAEHGAMVKLYISPIDITTSYFYVEYDDTICCYVHIYGIDILQSYYTEACRSQKEWIELHKRYSTLISGCNEMERFVYFNTQRNHIMNLGRV